MLNFILRRLKEFRRGDLTVSPIVSYLGEIGITGVAGALANAVYHATGRRIRELPITLDKLIA